MSGSQRRLLVLAVLVVVGLGALVGLFGDIRALAASALGFVAVVAVGGAWVTACVFLAVTAAIESGRMHDDRRPAVAAPRAPEPRAPEPARPQPQPQRSDTDPAGLHVTPCPGCEPVMVVAPQNRPVRMWQCQAKFGMPPT